MMRCSVRARLLPGLWGLSLAVAIVGLRLHERCVAQVSAVPDQQPGISGGLPPLVIDSNAPLLMDHAPKPSEASPQDPDKPLADNSACYVCHDNYREEPLVVWHAVEGTGCVDCHGESFAHRNDENNITPPDTMFSARRIDSSCRECHSTHDVAARDVLLRFQECCPEKTDPWKLVCTDCHGQHRLQSRTVRWEKRTGKLLQAQ